MLWKGVSSRGPLSCGQGTMYTQSQSVKSWCTAFLSHGNPSVIVLWLILCSVFSVGVNTRVWAVFTVTNLSKNPNSSTRKCVTCVTGNPELSCHQSPTAYSNIVFYSYFDRVLFSMASTLTPRRESRATRAVKENQKCCPKHHILWCFLKSSSTILHCWSKGTSRVTLNSSDSRYNSKWSGVLSGFRTNLIHHCYVATAGLDILADLCSNAPGCQI